MPRPPIDLHQKVRDLLGHTEPLPAESSRPIEHYERYTNDCINMIRYMDRHIGPAGIYEAVLERHMAMMRRMALGSLIQAFERFLKEVAIVCVDHVAPHVLDGRFDSFEPRGSSVAINFTAGTVGKAMCEADTWLNNSSVNERFRQMLKSPFGNPWDYLFPNEQQQPVGDRNRAKTLAVLWQLRHNLAHNVGAVTRSDALKLRLLVKGNVVADRLLSPEENDLRYVKRFLFETAEVVNTKVGDRLAALLTEIHRGDPTLFDARQAADSISNGFGYSLTVDGAVGAV